MKYSKLQKNEHVIGIPISDTITLGTVSDLFKPEFFTISDIIEKNLLINNTSIPFLMITMQGLKKHVITFCKRASTQLRCIILRGIVTEKTEHAKIKRLGYDIYINGEPNVIYCYLIDERTMMWFPLPDNTEGEKRIMFRYDDVELIIPTKFTAFESMISGISSLRFGLDERGKTDFVTKIGIFFATASRLYPHSIVWDEMHVPPVITMIASKLRDDTSLFQFFTTREREYLNLEMYDPEIYDDLEEQESSKSNEFSELKTIDELEAWLRSTFKLKGNERVHVKKTRGRMTIDILTMDD